MIFYFKALGSILFNVYQYVIAEVVLYNNKFTYTIIINLHIQYRKTDPAIHHFQIISSKFKLKIIHIIKYVNV